jgi:excisionase family DNA binding protein
MTYYTTAQAAALRGVARITVLKWVRHKMHPLPAVKHGRDWLIASCDLDGYKPARPGRPKHDAGHGYALADVVD